MNKLDHYFLALTVTGILHLVLSGFVLSKNIKSRLYQTYALYSISISIWSILEAIAITHDKHEVAFMLWKISFAGIIFIPVFFVHFVFELQGVRGGKRRLIPASYFTGCAFLYFNFFSTLFIRDVAPVFTFKYFFQISYVFYVFFPLWLSWAIYGLVELYGYYKASHSVYKKKQIKCFLVAMSIAYCGGVPNYFPAFNIEIPVLMPYGTYAVAFYAMITAYAITRFHLMDIQVAIKKTMVYSLSAGLLTGFFVVLILLMTEILSVYSGHNSFIVSMIAALAMALLFNPLKNKVQSLVDNVFYKTRYNYFSIIKTTGRRLAGTINARDIHAYIVDTIIMTLRLNSVYLLSGDNQCFKVVYFRLQGDENRNEDTIRSCTLGRESNLLGLLEDKKEIVIMGKLSGVAEQDRRGKAEQELKEYKGEIAVPIFVGNELSSIVILGEKLSGDMISEEDIILLHTIANQASVSLENARLYSELAQKVEELQEAYDELKSTQSQMLQKEKMASIGQLAAGVAHEINNPIGFISSNLGSLGIYTDNLAEFIKAQSGVVESLHSPEVMESLQQQRKKLKIDYILKDIRVLIDESREGAERVKEIVLNLNSFSRVDGLQQREADINECIESTLKIVWNELKYKAKVEKNYGELPMVMCHPQQLNQVFMNLLVNAAQAIEKQGEIRIKTWNGDGAVNVAISDTGRGIPEENINRIFEPFYTTKEVGKGTGLGLSIIYNIVKKHHGEIKADSKAEEGTTFTVRIPVSGTTL